MDTEEIIEEVGSSLISRLSPRTKLLVVGGTTLVSGFAAGYLFRRRQESTLIEITETVEIIDAEVVDDNQLVLQFNEAAKDYTVEKVELVVADDETVQVAQIPEPINIFRSSEDSWDYATESRARTTQEHYVIHYDEYFEDENGWDSQSTLTFYEADSVLCDETDTPVTNAHLLMPHLKFGHGSGDPNTVYIRDEKLHAEYEVLRDRGSYENEVLGANDEPAELRHSMHKFRLDE